MVTRIAPILAVANCVITSAQPFDRNVLFAIIAVHRRFACHFSRHVLHVRKGRGDHAAVGLDHPHVADLNHLISAVESETQ